MTRTVVLLVAVLFAVAYAGTIASTDRALFEQFKVTYNKQYDADQEVLRFEIFRSNIKRASVLQEMDPNAEFGVTQFMDLEPEEFASFYLMQGRNFTQHHDKQEVETILPGNSGPPPTTYDWRSAGAVTPVYNQEQCGSCWAFSTTEEIESQWFLAGNKLTQLSMQQVVSCDRKDGGCNGGEPPTAYEYVISAGGIESYQAYPYTSGGGNSGYCQFQASKIVAKISNWAWVSRSPKGNETAMLDGSWQYGPLSICVDASTWQYYRGGILSSNCGLIIDHCVQLVGWSTSNTNIPYWIVRNSWGVTWGEQGYIWIERNKNLCAIANECTRAII